MRWHPPSLRISKPTVDKSLNQSAISSPYTILIVVIADGTTEHGESFNDPFTQIMFCIVFDMSVSSPETRARSAAGEA